VNVKRRETSPPKPVCPHCEQPLGWLTRQLHGRFCSQECQTAYQEWITKLAMERLNAAMPPSRSATVQQSRPAPIVLNTGTEPAS
jgi:endogenous inhibitor of DNA gyrase (YacG/DUF329 family)